MQKLLLLFLVIGHVGLSLGSSPESKLYTKQKDLLDGQLQGISISSRGGLILAPATKLKFNSERLFIWDLAADQNGNLWIATGDEAKIYRIDPSNNSTLISHWKDVEVYCLAIDQKGVLYAATSPEGIIYRFNEENRTAKVFCQLKVKYIWDMIFDDQNRCYVATGDSGSIYVIDSQGRASCFYQSDETHIRCLAWGRNKQLLAGSYPDGYIYQLNPSGQAFIIYDSEFQEIDQICLTTQGIIYAAALAQGESEQAFPVEKKDEGIKSSSKGSEVSSISLKLTDRAEVSKSGIIKILPNGVIKNIWTQSSDVVQSIFFAADQSLYVGVSEKGRLFKISPDDEVTCLLTVDASQIVAFSGGTTGTIWFATSNLGKIFQLESKFIQQGTYESAVIDAGTLAKWGSVQWEQMLPPGCAIRFYTRSGNTKKPNSTWSPWIACNNGEPIVSPGARFLQWRLQLTTEDNSRSPEITNLRISYLQQNLPPEVVTITVHPVEPKIESQPSVYGELPAIEIRMEEEDVAGVAKQPLAPGARQPLRDGYRRITWQAQDRNNDQLSYTLYFQHKDDHRWWLLKDDLLKSNYTWDSRMMPDGIYRIKVIADDKKSNPINTARQGERVSDWFVIDNTEPIIEHLKATTIGHDSLQIAFKVVDRWSSIKYVDFSYDVQKWWRIYPIDLVCDSRQEDFQFRIELDRDGVHSLVIRATDEADNKGYGRTTLKE